VVVVFGSAPVVTLADVSLVVSSTDDASVAVPALDVLKLPDMWAADLRDWADFRSTVLRTRYARPTPNSRRAHSPTERAQRKPNLKSWSVGTSPDGLTGVIGPSATWTIGPSEGAGCVTGTLQIRRAGR